MRGLPERRTGSASPLEPALAGLPVRGMHVEPHTDRTVVTDITVEELAAALIRTGWYFPSQRADARTAAQDILTCIETDRQPGGDQ